MSKHSVSILFMTMLTTAAGCGIKPTRPYLKSGVTEAAGGESGDANSKDPKADTEPSIPVASGSNPSASMSPSQPPIVASTPSPTPTPIPTPIPTPTPEANACGTATWEKIVKPEDATCFATREAAFTSLPDAVKPFWIFMRDSRSAQISSVEKPRAIVMAPDGSFIVSTASDENARKDLEVAVFDYSKQEWQFAGIDYSTTPPTVEKELCKTCHGKELQHPIWSDYGFWKGAYAAGNNLEADESAFINTILSGTATSPLLKSLKFLSAKNYATGKRLEPLTARFAGENGQVLNYVTMQKTAQVWTSRILKDPMVTQADVLSMSSELSCDNKNTTLTKFGYTSSKIYNLGLEGVDRAGNMFNGDFSTSDYLAAELLGRAIAADPSLKLKLPTASKQFDNPIYKYFTTKGLREHTALMSTLKVGLRDIMSEFLSPSGNGLGAALKSPAHCNEIKALIGK